MSIFPYASLWLTLLTAQNAIDTPEPRLKKRGAAHDDNDDDVLERNKNKEEDNKKEE